MQRRISGPASGEATSHQIIIISTIKSRIVRLVVYALSKTKMKNTYKILAVVENGRIILKSILQNMVR